MNAQSEQTEVERLRAQVAELRRQITIKDDSLRRKNLALDAMHYVWCSGGCKGGAHRYTDNVIDAEVLIEAEANVNRIRTWYQSHLYRKYWEEHNGQTPQPRPAREPIEHELKSWPLHFTSLANGSMPFDARRRDRDYQVGDTVKFREWDPRSKAYTGAECVRTISHILMGPNFGIGLGWCVLGFSAVSRP